jgi:hypothetical protein
VTHLAGQSTSQIHPQSQINLWRSRLRLYKKHDSPLKFQIARVLIRLGMRRQIVLAQKAFAAGKLSAAERDALIGAYRAIQTL